MDFVDIGLWVCQALLALGMAGAGAMKAATPREKLMGQMKWVARFPSWAPRAIGIAEVAGAVGIILPWATGILPILDRKSTRLNSSHSQQSRMPSSA